MKPTIDPRIMNRLQGLLALTASDNEHEAQNAQAKLEALCKKYGVDILDLCDAHEEKEVYWFRYDSAQSKTVLLQTAAKVLGEDGNSYYKNSSKQLYLGFKCTKSMSAELSLWWSVMRAAFKKHEEASTIAFVHANRLYPSAPSQDERPPKELTDVDRAALAMSRNIKPTEVLQAIGRK